MIDLYLVFFLVGGIIFAGIVWYSMLLQRGRDQAPKEDYIDPLFAELEDNKAKQKNAVLSAAVPDVAPSIEDKAQELSSLGVEKQEPSLTDKVVRQPGQAQKDSKASNHELLPVIEESLSEKAADRLTESEIKVDESKAESVRRENVSAPPQIETALESNSISNIDADGRSDTSKSGHEKKAKSEPSISKPSKDRRKSKSFTQKLAEKVAKRSSAKQATATEATLDKQPAPSIQKVVSTLSDDEQPLTDKPVKPEASKPKLDKQASSIVTDLVARVKNPEPIEQQGLLALFRKHDFKFHRKVHIYGLNQLTDLWRDIEFEMPSARFVELGVSIQLADRDGAMTEKELHDFQQMTLEFSNNFDAPFEFSMDIDGALKQAQLLDQIGRRYDAMAVLNVVPKTKSGFRMADIESCARDLMMSTDKNGIFMKTQGQKHDVSVLYRLACTDGSGHFGLSKSAIGPVHDLVVYMNVPATTDPEAVFQQMVKDANSLATWLEGKVVDRAGRAMTQRSYSMLMQQISDIAFSMQQDGLIPGDDISKKIF